MHLSPQEAAFGVLVALFYFVSKPYFPLQWASAVKVRQDWGAAVKEVGGREMEERKNKRKAWTIEGFCSNPLLTPFPFIKHCSTPLRPPPSLFLSLAISKQTRSPSHTWRAFKTAISHRRSQAPRAYTHTHTSTQTHKEPWRAVLPFNTYTHMFCIPQCLSWLYIACWVTHLFVLL